MAKTHIVRDGDCVASVAFEHGFFPDTLWHHPDNAELRSERGDPNVLLSGDALHVPDLRPKHVPCATGQRHKFRRRGVPETLKLQLLKHGKPRAHIPFSLDIDGAVVTGRTGADGTIAVPIPPNAKAGLLTLPETGEELRLRLGSLDPIEEITGAQARLANLGFYRGKVDGEESPRLTAAVESFQTSHGLPPTGKLDPTTRQKLKAVHRG